MDKILILRIIMLISLIILLTTFNLVAKNDCQKCEFEIDGEQINAEEFMSIYFNKCIYPYKTGLPDIYFGGLNISEIEG